MSAAGRSKHAVDVMFRLWDAHKSLWVKQNARSLWVSHDQVEKLREKLVAAGRNPAHLTVERVFVEVK